ncbi:MAG: cobalamin-dependent protein, partial [Candidatus Omnitrophica bacterium]|nr:cobalamin-dependent protein [Candidatus Omnitrophota bacterium]
MRFRRILLVNPAYPRKRVKVVFCAGLGYIAQMLQDEGFQYDVLDMSLGYSYKDLNKKILNFKPELIGISMMTYRYKDTYSMIKQIKSDFPNISIVVGGPHVSLFRQVVLYDCPEIDYGVVLEGEHTLIELCKGYSYESIKGLIFRKQGAIIYNGDRPFIEKLDELPFPRYEKFELGKSFNKHWNALPIVSSRGCPFECIYCTVR